MEKWEEKQKGATFPAPHVGKGSKDFESDQY
jgi:hypothetical protein